MKVVITVASDYLNQIREVAQKVQSEGVQITGVHEFGVITGDTQNQVVQKIRAFDEIADVKEDVQVSIPPPDSDIQ